METIQEQLDELTALDRDTDRMLAVLEHQAQENSRKEKDYLKEFKELREEAGLLVVEEVEKEIREQKRKLEETEEKMLRLKEEETADRVELLPWIRELFRKGICTEWTVSVLAEFCEGRACAGGTV